MANRIEYPEPGRFRLVIDDFGELNNEDDASALQGKEFSSFNNILVHLRGPATRRGAITAASGDNSNSMFSANAGAIRFYDGPLKNSNLTTQPYYGFATDESTLYQIGTAAGVSIGHTVVLNAAASQPYSHSTMVGDIMVQGYASAGVPDNVMLGGGTAHAVVTTGTATFTTASTTVTLSSALSAANQVDIIGSFIVNTQDAKPCVYRIVSVTDANNVVIDRAYGGDRSTVASTYEISPLYRLKLDTVEGCAVSGTAVAAIAIGAWGRLVLANTVSNSSLAAGNRKPNRIVWSGLVGNGDDGTSPFTGMFSFEDTAFLDLAPENGAIVGMHKWGSGLLVLQERAVTHLFGAPTTSSSVGIDASTVYTGFRPKGGTASCITPEGVVFIDKAKGACIWSGGGPPRQLNMAPVLSFFRTALYDGVGYYRDYLFFASSLADSGSQYWGLYYHMPTGRWCKLIGNSSSRAQVDFIPGRSDGTATTGTHYLVARVGNRLLNISNIIDSPNVLSTDGEVGGSAPFLSLTSAIMGDTSAVYRPEKLTIRYGLGDPGTTNPVLSVVVYTSENRTNSWTDATSFSETSQYGTTTKVVNVGTIEAGNAVSLAITAQDTNSQLCRQLIHYAVVEGTVEGEIAIS